MNTPTLNKITIETIKTDIAYFVRLFKENGYSNYDLEYGQSGLEHYFFDGEKAEKTHSKVWLKISKQPEKVEIEQSQPNINYRYELIDKSLESAKFPLVFRHEDVAIPDEEYEYGDWVWKDEFCHLKSLYKLVFDTQPNLMVNIDFEVKIILEVDNIKEYGGFSYPIQKTRWEYEGFLNLTEKSVTHELIDTIIFPDIVLPARKSHLTSKQTYKIIRKHIQDNINPKYAYITSDYDFCFTVEKKIPLAQKIAYQRRDISRYGAEKPKYITDYRENRGIKVFEMTNSEDNYKGYTVIEGFKGNNVEELKENIDNYLKNLMDIINAPLKDCPNCQGKGVLVEK